MYGNPRVPAIVFFVMSKVSFKQPLQYKDRRFRFNSKPIRIEYTMMILT